MFSTVLIYSPPADDSPAEKGCNCWRPDKRDCRDVKKEKVDYLEPDLDDIADSLMQVMRICKLRAWEVRRTKEAIKRSFRHYEEIRNRIDRVPKKRFNKENFIHDITVEAGMERLDGHLANGIVKRAFHAYYHGTGEGGRRLESFAKQMQHRSDCLWRHAAKRTAEIYAIYAGLMYSEQKQYEECIECVYLNLFKDLQSRFKYETSEIHVCQCKPDSNRVESVWDALSGTTMMSATTNLTTELFFNKHTFEATDQASAVSINLEYTMILEQTVNLSEQENDFPKAPVNKSSNQTIISATSNKSKSDKKKKSKKKKKRDIKCKCPSLQCVNEEKPPPVITAECSQGPYICRWIPHEETFPAHCVPCPPMEDICPPCDDNIPCDYECTCTCQVCTCPPADEFVEEEHAEKLSGSGLEDRDTDFCWLAPFNEGPMMKKVESSENEEEMGDEEQLFECRCTCEYKRRAFPHLFTYLEPFKPEKKVPEIEIPVEEPIKPRKPPCGISMETYRCWNEPPKAEEDDSESICKTCPHIVVLSAAQIPGESAFPKVKGITMDVSVKKQHFPPQGSKDQTKNKQPQGNNNKRKSTDSGKKLSIKELQSNVKAQVPQKVNLPTPKLPEIKKNSPPADAIKPKPNTVPAPTEDTLTKEDIMDMLGLRK